MADSEGAISAENIRITNANNVDTDTPESLPSSKITEVREPSKPARALGKRESVQISKPAIPPITAIVPTPETISTPELVPMPSKSVEPTDKEVSVQNPLISSLPAPAPAPAPVTKPTREPKIRWDESKTVKLFVTLKKS